jgi:general secretion pathway protein G
MEIEMAKRIMNARRGGFTLVEVLVTLVLIALLVGVVLPSVVNQLDRGEPTRVTADLEAIRAGAKMFRIDVKRYPATLEQLSEAPGGSGVDWTRTTDFNDAEIGPGLLANWGGPYIEGSSVMDEATPLSTVLGGEIQPVFIDSLTMAGVPYLAVEVTGLDSASIARINEAVDGLAAASMTNPDIEGRIRMAEDVADDFRLYFMALPIN